MSEGVPRKLSDCEPLKDVFATVPLLFKYVREVMARKPDAIEVAFDPTLGYPLKFEVDYSKDLSDDYFIFEISGFDSTK